MLLSSTSEGLFPDLGQGLGLRPQHYPFILEHQPSVDWFEIISENYMGLAGEKLCADTIPALGGRPVETLELIRRDYPIACHGVSLSIGSTDDLDYSYLKRLKSLIERFEPAIISDHLCWTGVNGENVHDLLPLPYTTEALEHLVSRIREVQDFLGRRILIENVSSYMSFEHSTMTEWDFLNEVAQRADCGLLLDVNNIYVSAKNHGFCASEFLSKIDRNRVGQMHLAGHSDMGNYFIDTHDQPVCEGVWCLYREAVERLGEVSTMIERDGNIPPFEELFAESQFARSIEESVLGKNRSRKSSLERARAADPATTISKEFAELAR